MAVQDHSLELAQITGEIWGERVKLRNKTEFTILVKTIPEGLHESIHSNNGTIPIAQDKGFMIVRLCFVSPYVGDDKEGL